MLIHSKQICANCILRLPIIHIQNCYPKQFKYILQIQKMSTNIQQFKQQTFSLIKQQATKIKSHAKEIQIKQEQIRLLKQTITSLEEENQELTKNKMVLANKIQVIMEEVNNYNNTIVKKLHSDNQMLSAKLQDVSSSLEQSLHTVRRLTEQLQISEENCNKYSTEAQKLKDVAGEGTKQMTKLRNQHTKYKQLAGEQQKRINKLEALNQQYEDKIKWQEKQIDNLVNKLQQAANSYEKKIKNLKEGLVKKQQLTKYEQESAKIAKKAEDLKKQLDKMSRQKNQLLLNMKILKEKDITLQLKIQTEDAVLQADIRSLKDSCKTGKKINEFECKFHAVFNDIEDEFRSIKAARDEAVCKNQLLIDRISLLEKELSLKQVQLEQEKHELQIISQKLKNQATSIESSYEGKILQLSMKIKKQQKALQQLGIKDKQFSDLTEEYQKLAQQHIEMKDSLQNTITQYKKENQKLTSQIQELIQLCDQNINTRNSLNSLKHTINNLLGVIYFLHLNLVRNRQARRKIWQPLFEFYFTVKSSIQKYCKQGSRQSKLRKFRACANVLIAIKRMSKNAKQSQNTGILRYVDKAIKTKGKIEQLNEHLQRLLEKAIKGQKNVIELIKQNKNTYRWNTLHNYQKLNIPINWYKNKLDQKLQ